MTYNEAVYSAIADVKKDMSEQNYFSNQDVLIGHDEKEKYVYAYYTNDYGNVIARSFNYYYN